MGGILRAIPSEKVVGGCLSIFKNGGLAYWFLHCGVPPPQKSEKLLQGGLKG